MSTYDLKRLETAIQYIRRMSAGRNPVTNKPAPENEVLGNVNVHRCLKFIDEVLTDVHGSGGVVGQLPQRERSAKIPPSELFPYETLQQYRYLQDQQISFFLKQLEEYLPEGQKMPVAATTITGWLRENGYLENGLDDRDNYYMKHVYVACVRAIDYLTSLPEWDGRNVAVQGGSQGGALALITAGLDPRVTACVANHPALSDMAGYLDNRAGGYPHFNRENKMLTPEKVKTMQYYDVVNFARRISCPTFLTWGFNDNTCPPTTSYIVWNLITAPKESLVTPINEHWTTAETNYRQMVWIKERLR